MKNILVHGLGQNKESWSDVKRYLKEKDVDVECPNLFEMQKSKEKNFKKLYHTFATYCNNKKEKLNLCGLSLGGLLVLEYAKEYHEKVNSIILIGTPYKIPKMLFKIQNIIFKLMPNKTFEPIGISKNAFCCLVNSMYDIEISKNLEKIECKSLVLCGVNDNVNIKSAKQLSENLSNSCLEIVNDSSHEVNVDNPKELSNIICNFWKEN